MQENFIYYKYSDFLKNTYGEKVYKLPLNIKTTCPNRDGNKGKLGCYFCSQKGGVHDIISEEIPVKEQIEIHKKYFNKRYKAKKFIAYFQSYTNTYLDMNDFRRYMKEAVEEDIVEICVSTRPDCIDEEVLDILKEIESKNDIKITVELGLQSINEDTLIKINRGHTVEDYKNAVKLIQKYGFFICTHIIGNLPWDSDDDIINLAKLFNEQKIDIVKVHSLYISKDSVFSEMYKAGEFDIISVNEYMERVIKFLENLSSNIAIARLTSSAPKDSTDFCNWGISRWKIRDDIYDIMLNRKTYQGRALKDEK